MQGSAESLLRTEADRLRSRIPSTRTGLPLGWAGWTVSEVPTPNGHWFAVVSGHTIGVLLGRSYSEALAELRRLAGEVTGG